MKCKSVFVFGVVAGLIIASFGTIGLSKAVIPADVVDMESIPSEDLMVFDDEDQQIYIDSNGTIEDEDEDYKIVSGTNITWSNYDNDSIEMELMRSDEVVDNWTMDGSGDIDEHDYDNYTYEFDELGTFKYYVDDNHTGDIVVSEFRTIIETDIDDVDIRVETDDVNITVGVGREKRNRLFGLTGEESILSVSIDSTEDFSIEVELDDLIEVDSNIIGMRNDAVLISSDGVSYIMDEDVDYEQGSFDVDNNVTFDFSEDVEELTIRQNLRWSTSFRYAVGWGVEVPDKD